MVAVRKALESLYKGFCTISNKQEVTDEQTHQTRFTDVIVVENQPCRLSFSTITAATPGTGATTLKEVVKLFIAPEITVLPGSKITVTQNGMTTLYKSSGKPATHSNHQEIILELDDDYS